MTTIDAKTLQARLDALVAEHKIPGAAAAVLQGDDVIEAASGVINKNTGIEATTDTLFQIGSISKVWTASLVMMAVDEGLLDLDEPIVTYLPEFKVADPDVTKKVTLRHLLSHSSGIGGDHILETGRGDDTLANYVATCGELGQEHDLGATMSYCNTGYSVAGRILEKIYGGPDKSALWDQILRERIIQPLGLTHTNTLPEEAILFRTAVGHVTPPGASEPQVAPYWVLPRSAGPAGLINATPADLLTFVRMHLDDGRGPDGTQLLSPASVKVMQEPQIDVPDRWTLGDKWGVGWILFDWDGHRVYGHDGNTVGQSAYLRVLPEQRIAVCLLTNGGTPGPAFRKLVTEVFASAGVEVPPMPVVPDTPADVDLANYEGDFRRLNVEANVARGDDGGLVLTVRATGPLAERQPEEARTQKLRLVPVDNELFVATAIKKDESAPDTPPMPCVFFDFDDDGRPKRYHLGARAMTRA